MPHKIWAIGEEVLAADFNDFVQEQVVATFPNAAARTSGLVAPVEGQLTYLADVDSLELWSGSAWRKVRHEATAQAVVTAHVVKNTIPGTGGQVTFNMTGWADIPVVNVQLKTAFAWSVTVSALDTPAAFNVKAFDSASGNPIPDSTGLDLLVIGVGTPSGPAAPTIS